MHCYQCISIFADSLWSKTCSKALLLLRSLLLVSERQVSCSLLCAFPQELMFGRFTKSPYDYVAAVIFLNIHGLSILTHVNDYISSDIPLVLASPGFWHFFFPHKGLLDRPNFVFSCWSRFSVDHTVKITCTYRKWYSCTLQYTTNCWLI